MFTRSPYLRGLILIAIFMLRASVRGADAPESPRQQIKQGDTVAVLRDGTKLVLGEKILAEMPKGTKLSVTAVNTDWIGGETKFEGKTLRGWVSASEVALLGPWPTWKRILGEGRVFAPDDLVLLATTYKGMVQFGMIDVSANLSAGFVKGRSSRLFLADLVAAYGEPDARRDDSKSADRWILAYGPIELYVSKKTKEVYCDSLNMPNLLWMGLCLRATGEYPMNVVIESAKDVTLDLPPPLKEPKAPQVPGGAK